MTQEENTSATDDATPTQSAIAEAVNAPQIVIVDGQHVHQRPIPELIAADAYLKKLDASANPAACLKIVKLSHSGA